jgi:hypothetical protein
MRNESTSRDESDPRVPKAWLRAIGIIGAAYLAVYAVLGVARDDLQVSLSKSGAGVHLHGGLAWMGFLGMMMMSIGMALFLAPRPGEGAFDFDSRRRRFGPIFAVGLVLYIAAQGFANLRS